MIELRKITPHDLEVYQHWKMPQHKYHELNGPYFEKKSEDQIANEIEQLRIQFEGGNSNPLPNRRIISNLENKIIGEVSWYWKSKETLWMEVGIVIFNEDHWGKGYGSKALMMWTKHLFDEYNSIVRLGLSTWSGNKGMIKLAEKIGMQKEAQYRKARIVGGSYYDAVSYGILREEFLNLNS